MHVSRKVYITCLSLNFNICHPRWWKVVANGKLTDLDVLEAYALEMAGTVWIVFNCLVGAAGKTLWDKM